MATNKMCNVCGKRRKYTGSGPGVDTAASTGMCNFCYTEGGHENTHNDSNHDAILQEIQQAKAEGLDPAEALKTEALEEIEGCWICYPELNLAQKPVKAKATGTKKTQGARRPQLNHKQCTHEQTPEGRRTCRKAFWEFVTAEGYTEATVLADHFVAWYKKQTAKTN